MSIRQLFEHTKRFGHETRRFFSQDFINYKPSLRGLLTFRVRLPSDVTAPRTYEPDARICAPIDPGIENLENLLPASLERTNMTNVSV